MPPRRFLIALPLAVLASLVVAWFLWSPLLGADPLGPMRPAPLPKKLTPAAARLYATTVPAQDLPRLAFADALDYLRDGSGAQIFVNWRALEAAGVSKDAPVALRTAPTRLEPAVRNLLDQLRRRIPAYDSTSARMKVSLPFRPTRTWRGTP